MDFTVAELRPLARWLASHPDVRGLTAIAVYEDEGEHLPSVYRPLRPMEARGGSRSIRSSTHRGVCLHRTGRVRPAARRLVRYCDTSKAVVIEKSPPNLIRMRFLRSLFPKARFIIVIRHPIAVSLATRKWRRASNDRLIEYWLAGHRSLVEDARAVGDVAVIRYEDLMADPAAELDRVFAFLCLPAYHEEWPIRTGINDAYFSQFRSSRWPWRNWSDGRIVRRHEEAVAPFGYSLIEPGRLATPAQELAALRPAPRVSAPVSEYDP